MVVSASCQQQQREKLLQQTATAIANANAVKMEVGEDGEEEADEEDGEAAGGDVVKVEVKAEPCEDDEDGRGDDEISPKGSY